LPPSSGLKSNQVRNQHEVGLLAYSSVLKMVETCSSETSVNFNKLHGIIFQKIELYITTAVRTLNPVLYRLIQVLESMKYC
jgi:hypothetical protein